MKTQIKECKKFGSYGSHIIMTKNDIGKKFLVLPESSKYILVNILKHYHKALDELTNPKLSEFLSNKEFEALKEVYLGVINTNHVSQHKQFLQSSYKNLSNFTLKDIERILTDVEGYLPKSLKNKLMAEWFKKI